MGLDLVELVMEVEETFGFTIRDEDAANIRTAGELYDCVMAHFEGREQGCLSSFVFYRLRRAFMTVLGLARKDVHLSSELARVIPSRRRKTWSDLQAAMGLRLPELVRPGWVTAMTTTAGIAIVIAASIFLILATRVRTTGGAIALIVCIMCAVSYVLYQATRPFAVAFRPEFATVGGLTKSILHHNYGVISDKWQRANAEEVWTTLRTLIVEQLGVRPEDVTKEASFVEDLRID
jgi:acyl carrier protein